MPISDKVIMGFIKKLILRVEADQLITPVYMVCTTTTAMLSFGTSRDFPLTQSLSFTEIAKIDSGKKALSRGM